MRTPLLGNSRCLGRAVAATALVLALLAAGCDDGAGPVEDITGHYELQSVDGKKLPAQVGAFMWYAYSVLTLNANGTYGRFDVFNGDGFFVTDADAGTYARTSEKLLLFDSNSQDSFQAELSGTSIKASSPHGVALYKRVPL